MAVFYNTVFLTLYVTNKSKKGRKILNELLIKQNLASKFRFFNLSAGFLLFIPIQFLDLVVKRRGRTMTRVNTSGRSKSRGGSISGL